MGRSGGLVVSALAIKSNCQSLNLAFVTKRWCVISLNRTIINENDTGNGLFKTKQVKLAMFTTCVNLHLSSAQLFF